MILLINICKEKLHYYEFVKPVEDILRLNGIKYLKRHYKKIKGGDWGNIDKIIICGTSLKDCEYIKDIDYFRWIYSSKKPILGICAGMQVIGLSFELDRQVKELDIKNNFEHFLKKKTEIGFYTEVFGKTSVSPTSKNNKVGDKENLGSKDFLGLKGEQEVYHLHNYYVDFSKLRDFEVFSSSKISQAVKCNIKEIYGVLFHPEVRQKDLIKNFCLL